MSEEFHLDVEFSKRAVDEDRRLVGGYAYVAKRNGETTFDSQGDSIDAEDLRAAVHDFMKSSRTMGVQHIPGPNGEPIRGGEIVEMAVLAGDFMPEGMPRDQEGLWIVGKFEDDAAWRLVKAGFLSSFSIGGKAIRELVA